MRAKTAKRFALHDLVRTFFCGSREEAVAALLEVSPAEFSEKELDRPAQSIEKARNEKKRCCSRQRFF
jgi:hypothetical protein